MTPYQRFLLVNKKFHGGLQDLGKMKDGSRAAMRILHSLVTKMIFLVLNQAASNLGKYGMRMEVDCC